MKRIAIVDDEKRLAKILQRIIGQTGHHVTVFNDPLEFVAALETNRWDVVLTDYKMPNLSGMDVLFSVKARHPQTAVLLMTAMGTVEIAVDAMKNGAFDFIEKPFQNTVIKSQITSALQAADLDRETASLRTNVQSKYNPDRLIAQSASMRSLLSSASKAAESEVPVLINGERGVGKESLARAIHHRSRRCDRPFLRFDCRGFHASSAHDALFGAPGKTGALALANGGTLYLHDIAQIDHLTQASLLRLVENDFRSSEEDTALLNVRLIAASKRDLTQSVRSGDFRSDLFYRLSILPLDIPPLRERTEDISKLAEHFFEKYTIEFDRKNLELTDSFVAKLKDMAWPGNVQELESVVERAVVLAQGDAITDQDIAASSQTLVTPLRTFLHQQRDRHISKTLALIPDRQNAAIALGLTLEELETYELETL